MYFFFSFVRLFVCLSSSSCPAPSSSSFFSHYFLPQKNLERERDERAILQEQYSVLKEDLKKALNEADRSGMRTAMDEVAFLKQALREAQEQWSIEAETRVSPFSLLYFCSLARLTRQKQKELESQLARQPNHSISEIKEVGVATSPANLSNGRRSPVSPSSSASEEVVEGLKRTVGELEEELKRAREDSDDREEVRRKYYQHVTSLIQLSRSFECYDSFTTKQRLSWKRVRKKWPN